MSFRPNIRGPVAPFGEIVVTSAGTSVLLNDNWNPKWDSSAVTTAKPEQYAASFEDIVISSPPTNTGGIYVVTKDGSKDDAETILLYIPKGSLPVSLKSFMGDSRFAPENLAVDVDQDSDKVWGFGVL